MKKLMKKKLLIIVGLLVICCIGYNQYNKEDEVPVQSIQFGATAPSAVEDSNTGTIVIKGKLY